MSHSSPAGSTADNATVSDQVGQSSVYHVTASRPLGGADCNTSALVITSSAEKPPHCRVPAHGVTIKPIREIVV
jgi:hypothetical protein